MGAPRKIPGPTPKVCVCICVCMHTCAMSTWKSKCLTMLLNLNILPEYWLDCYRRFD